MPCATSTLGLDFSSTRNNLDALLVSNPASQKPGVRTCFTMIISGYTEIGRVLYVCIYSAGIRQ